MYISLHQWKINQNTVYDKVIQWKCLFLSNPVYCIPSNRENVITLMKKSCQMYNTAYDFVLYRA